MKFTPTLQFVNPVKEKITDIKEYLAVVGRRNHDMMSWYVEEEIEDGVHDEIFFLDAAIHQMVIDSCDRETSWEDEIEI